MASGSTIHNIAEAPLITGPRRARSKVNWLPVGRVAPELAIAPVPAELVRPTVPVVAGLELAIALAVAGLELAIALVLAEVVRPIVLVVAELELIALALAAAGNASVATMFLGAAVPARAVPLAVEVVG